MVKILKSNITNYLKTKLETITSNIKMNGTPSAGTSDKIARADHIHPSDTTKADVNHSHTKNDISDFSHTHQKSDISDFPTSMNPTAHTHRKSEITDFPNSMPPTSHTHQKSEITDFSHTHNYLPLAGGTITGPVIISQSAQTSNDNLVFAGAFQDTTKDIGSIMAGSRSLMATVYPSDKKWYNLISIRHRNSVGDGSNYGMRIWAPMTEQGNLAWQQQINTWQNSRVILDSQNYSTYASPKTHTHNDASTVTTLSIVNQSSIHGTVKIMKKNGWAIVTFEDLKIDHTTSGYAEVCQLPYVNQAGIPIYAQNFIDDAPSSRVRVGTNGYLELFQITAGKRVFGHIVYPTS